MPVARPHERIVGHDVGGSASVGCLTPPLLLAFFPSLNYVINNVINYVGKWQESLLASSIPEKYSSWSLVRAV